MALKRYKPTTSSRRHLTLVDKTVLWRGKPEKTLTYGLSRTGGRNNAGRITAPRRGSHAHRRVWREIDLKRKDFWGVPGIVERIEYDPNRTAHIALVIYHGGQPEEKKAYIIAPAGLKIGDTVMSGDTVPMTTGNATYLKHIPTGFVIHNVELKIGKGAQLSRTAGTSIQILGREGRNIIVRLTSGSTRLINENCMAVIGTVSNADHANQHLSKAGRNRWVGIRPRNRPVARNPIDHPMGGGEGKSSGGRHPCSRNGQPSKGYKTRNSKRTDKFIMSARKK